jgi:glutamyl-tRNA(Gln) amidotransferase subunit D
MALGCVPAKNMLPEVAYMKLGWALGQSQNLEEVKKIMLTPVAGEITPREPFNGYAVLQGGMPEVDQFLKNVV